MSDFHTDFHLNKLLRAKALAARCSQRLDPTVAKTLRAAQVVSAGDLLQVVFAGLTFGFTQRWVEGGSVEQIAEALTALCQQMRVSKN